MMNKFSCTLYCNFRTELVMVHKSGWFRPIPVFRCCCCCWWWSNAIFLLCALYAHLFCSSVFICIKDTTWAFVESKNISRKSRRQWWRRWTEKKSEDKSRVKDNYHPVAKTFFLITKGSLFFIEFFFLVYNLNTQACLSIYGWCYGLMECRMNIAKGPKHFAKTQT